MNWTIYIIIWNMFITADDLLQACMKLGAVIAFITLILCTTTVMAEIKTQEKKNLVIFIPGIMGSRLYNSEGNLVWMECSLKLTKLGERVSMQNTLMVKNNEIDQVTLTKHERDYWVIGPFEYPYKKIVDRLCDEFSDRGVYFFSYDFRQSNPDCADLLNQQIQNILQKYGGSKVDLVAHSLGGLIVSTYLEMYGEEHMENYNEAGNYLMFGYPLVGNYGANKDQLRGMTKFTLREQLCVNSLCSSKTSADTWRIL